MSQKDLSKWNAILLLLTLPFILRFWIEAVLWRIERGPQMLGFSLLHGGAGILTVPILLSLLAMLIYWLFVTVVAITWLFPAARAHITGFGGAIAGGAATFGFFQVASLLQRELPALIVYLGALLLSGLIVAVCWLSWLGFRHEKRVVA